MQPNKNLYTGSALAVLATLIWAGNFIIARGVYKQVPPFSLAFYRWAIASVILLPFTWKQFKTEVKIIAGHKRYFFWVALTGVAIFNTFVYIGAHYTSAINLALIGTTSSPVMAIILSRIFLRERIGSLKIIGMTLCIAGILYLLSKGNFQNLVSFRFSAGDGWVLLAAFSFAVYTTMVRKKPAAITPGTFLLTTFLCGTLLLLPFYLWEVFHTVPVTWTSKLFLIILYLGLGASVIAFFCWNAAITKLGAGRTALFGNLIPVISIMEAVLFLGEQFTTTHFISMGLVLLGLVLANMDALQPEKSPLA